MPFYEVLDVLNFVHDYLDTHKEEIGLNYIGYGDEEHLPNFPVAVVTPEPDIRAIKGTHQFERIFNLSVFVYHADLTVNHRIRTQQDMELATAVVRLLHANFTLDGNIVFGFVDGSSPGVVVRGGATTPQQIVSTRLTWTGQGREPFQHD